MTAKVVQLRDFNEVVRITGRKLAALEDWVKDSEKKRNSFEVSIGENLLELRDRVDAVRSANWRTGGSGLRTTVCYFVTSRDGRLNGTCRSPARQIQRGKLLSFVERTGPIKQPPRSGSGRGRGRRRRGKKFQSRLSRRKWNPSLHRNRSLNPSPSPSQHRLAVFRPRPRTPPRPRTMG
jgi:hypothetical protein